MESLSNSEAENFHLRCFECPEIKENKWGRQKVVMPGKR